MQLLVKLGKYINILLLRTTATVTLLLHCLKRLALTSYTWITLGAYILDACDGPGWEPRLQYQLQQGDRQYPLTEHHQVPQDLYLHHPQHLPQIPKYPHWQVKRPQ